jgi:hypothetical protein
VVKLYAQILILLLASQPLGLQAQDLCKEGFAELIQEGEIPASEFTELKKPGDEFSGENHQALYFAKLNERDVFIKVSYANSKTVGAYKTFEKEAAWVKQLSDLHIGPYFYGKTKLEGGYAMATEVINGKHVSDLVEFTQSEDLINQNTLHDLEKIRATFQDHGIIPMDFQFRIDEEGHVWVIDPAFFMQRGRDVPENFTQTGLGNVEKYIQYVRDLLR